MNFGNTSGNPEIVINNVSDNKYFVNFTIKRPEDYMYSSFIQTAPGMLCYYGDMDEFVFVGNIVAKQPLTFFKGCQYKGKVNYDYLYEKLENKKDAKEFNVDETEWWYMYHVSYYFGWEDILDNTTNKDNEKIKLAILKRMEEDTIDSDYFLEGFDLCEESRVYELYDLLYNQFEWNGFGFNTEVYTNMFIECCDRIVTFAEEVLNKIGFEDEK